MAIQVNHEPVKKQGILSKNPYANATIGILALTAIGVGIFFALHQFDWNKCKERIINFFSEQRPLRISIVSLVAASVIILPYGCAYVINFKNTHLKEEMMTVEGNAKLENILKKIARHNASVFFASDASLKAAIKSFLEGEVNEDQKISKEIALTNLWGELAKKMAEHAIDEPAFDPIKIIGKLADILPTESVVEGGGEVNLDAKFSNENALAAQEYLRAICTKPKIKMKTHLRSAIVGFASGIEMLLNSLGIADLVRPPNNELHASFKAQKLIMLINIFTVVSTMLIASLGSKFGGTLSAAIFGGLCFLSLTWAKIRPCPLNLPGGAVNWSLQYDQGILRPVPIRPVTVQDIANKLCTGRNVIIIGPPRTGKTRAAMKLVELIKQEKESYPQLAGKYVQYWSTPALVSEGGSNLFGGSGPLKVINDAMVPNNDQIIMVFDEIHAAFPAMAQQLKIYADAPPLGTFNHMICITTQEEYDTYVTDKAFRERFDVVHVTSTDPSETADALFYPLYQNPSNPQIANEKVLAKIIELSSEPHKDPSVPLPQQPFAAAKLLERCIRATEHATVKPVDDNSKKSKIKLAHRLFHTSAQEEQVDWADLDAKIKRTQQEEKRPDVSMNSKKPDLDKVTLKKYHKQKELINRTVKAMSKGIVKGALVPSKREEILKKQKMLEKFQTALLGELKKAKEEYGYSFVIDEEVVDNAKATLDHEIAFDLEISKKEAARKEGGSKIDMLIKLCRELFAAAV